MTKPKILFFDIETAPNLSYVWGHWEQNVIAHKQEWSLLSFAYKFLGNKGVGCETREGSKNDLGLVKSLYKLFDKADVVVAHNGNSFDIKKIKARMAFYNLPPTKATVSIDTKLVAKRYFSFNSNSLNDLGQHLGLGQKVKHPGFDMWLGCMRDDAASWKLMKRYNKMDVVLLEKVYKRFLPWIQNHPSIAKMLRPEDDRYGQCPNCGSSNCYKKGFRYSNTQVKQEWLCTPCGARFATRTENI